MAVTTETADARPATRLETGRENILQAAERAFLAKGYKASVCDIIECAGVVRQTLYNHFANKDELFAEVVRRLGRHLLVPLEADDGDLRATLVAFGSTLRDSILSDKWVALHRTMIAEAERFPGLAKTIYGAGRGRAVEQLAALLVRHADAGRIAVDDPRFAAEILLTLLVEPDRSKRLLGVPRPRHGEEGHVERVVDLFLRAFRPGQTSTES
jgi:TetR/AcrR family transcriptional repressor of mexJK operon